MPDSSSTQKPKEEPGDEQDDSKPAAGVRPKAKVESSDLMDHRKTGDWMTRYRDPVAQKRIKFEFAYIFGIIVATLIAIFVLWLLAPMAFGLSDVRYRDFQIYFLALLGGVLGGATFSMKWLYHSVAKAMWNQDRWIWRVSTPLTSGILSLVIVGLVRSQLIKVIDPALLTHLSGVLAFAFLTGYFSDNVIGAMLRLAEHVFGTVQSARGAIPTDRNDEPPGPGDG